MKLLHLTQVFELANDSGSDRHFFFCRHAVRKGWDAVAITSNVNYKTATARYPGKWLVTREADGVQVRYVYSFAGIRGSLARRVWYYVTYFAATIVDALRQSRPDVVYAVSTPLTVGFLGMLLSKIWRRPFVFEVTDLWPDAIVAVGLMRRGPMLTLAQWMERTCYRNAAGIVALTKGIREGIIAKGIGPEKVSLITNGFDPALFTAVDDGSRAAVRAKLALRDDQLLCMYLGAHGMYNSLETILGAAEHLRDRNDIAFVFVGDGDQKAPLQQQVEAKGLSNVHFLPPIPRHESVGVLSAADVFLLPNRAGAFYRMNLPNKLFDFLASARPVVVAGEGETAEVVSRAGAGTIVPAEDARAMAGAIADLRDAGAEMRSEMGRRGRAFVHEHYDREKLAEHFVEVIERAAG